MNYRPTFLVGGAITNNKINNYSYRLTSFFLFPQLMLAWSTMLQNKQIIVNQQVKVCVC